MNIDDKGNGEIIHLEHIQKSYYIGAEKVSVLRDIQLSVHQGEFISIMGPSGAGKSTLMNILGCLDRPTEGSYVLDGSEVSNLDIDYMPSEMSGGQRQRVAIARALVNHPAIIMADEPTGNLDSKSTSEVMEIFTGLHESGKTIILVTHELDVANFATRHVILSDGYISRDIKGTLI